MTQLIIYKLYWHYFCSCINSYLILIFYLKNIKHFYICFFYKQEVEHEHNTFKMNEWKNEKVNRELNKWERLIKGT